jgi:hypothetical protein
MGARVPTRPAKKTKTVQVRVAAVVDGFLRVMPAEKKPVREKVVRKLRALHPMD